MRRGHLLTVRCVTVERSRTTRCCLFVTLINLGVRQSGKYVDYSSAPRMLAVSVSARCKQIVPLLPVPLESDDTNEGIVPQI